MAWDRGAPLARCDDASKLPRSLADKLRALQRSAFSEEGLKALRPEDSKQSPCANGARDCAKKKREFQNIRFIHSFSFSHLAFRDFSSLSCHFWPFTEVQNGNQRWVMRKVGFGARNG